MILIRTYVLAVTYARLPERGVECGLAASFYSLSFCSMFANMVACDLLRFRAPWLRLMLALSVRALGIPTRRSRRSAAVAAERGSSRGASALPTVKAHTEGRALESHPDRRPRKARGRQAARRGSEAYRR